MNPKRYKIGDKVVVMLYNTPDKRYYGNEFEATILAIRSSIIDPTVKRYLIERPGYGQMEIKRKEIMRHAE